MLLYDAFYMYSDIMLFMIPWYIKNIIWCFVMYNNDGGVTFIVAACVSCVIKTVPCALSGSIKCYIVLSEIEIETIGMEADSMRAVKYHYYCYLRRR